jgi:hypothetical protein
VVITYQNKHTHASRFVRVHGGLAGRGIARCVFRPSSSGPAGLLDPQVRQKTKNGCAPRTHSACTPRNAFPAHLRAMPARAQVGTGRWWRALRAARPWRATPPSSSPATTHVSVCASRPPARRFCGLPTGHGCDATLALGSVFASGGHGPGSTLLFQRLIWCAATHRPPGSKPDLP